MKSFGAKKLKIALFVQIAGLRKKTPTDFPPILKRGQKLINSGSSK